MTTHSTTTPPDATASLKTAARPDRLRLAAEERETVLVWNDADRTWSVYSDSARKRRVARWLHGLGIEPTHSPGTGIEAEGIPEWAVSFRARKRRRHPGPLSRSLSTPSKPPVQRHPDGVKGTVGRETPQTGLDSRGSRVKTGPEGQTGFPGIGLEGDQH